MGNEATSLLEIEHTAHQCAYETMETTDAIAEAMGNLTTNYTVALVTIVLDFEAQGKIGHGRFATDAHTSISYLLNNLRPLVRKTDAVFLLNATLHFLLLGANLQGGQIVQTRLWDALLWRIHSIAQSEILRPSSISIGHSAYPTPCSDVGKLIEVASDASLYASFTVEKPVRKIGPKQEPTVQQASKDEELPALARKLGIPYLSLLPKNRPERVQQLVNSKLAQELHCYPLGRERNTLTVAMLDPQDCAALERLHQETGMRIFPILTHPQELQTVLEQLL
ncbi:MAG: hypothetical protein NVS4B7_05190 [Ktedonobacteraceae bacterium]